jgi:hypothetical protein
MTERELSDNLADTAKVYKWLAYHTFDSRRSEPGFPDWVLIRERLLVVELKSERGKVAPAQYRWLKAFEDAGADTRVWRPQHWLSGEIEETLKAEIPSPRQALSGIARLAHGRYPDVYRVAIAAL